MNFTIGIDLGTTNSAGVVLKDGKMKVVPSEEGPTAHGKMLSSVVAFKTDGKILVGKKAKEYSIAHPERVVRWIKRKMGTDHLTRIDGLAYTPQEISSFILRKIKSDAERYLGESIDQAVITAPAYFNNNQRNATKEAGELAGFEVLRVISEPTAAALAYGLNHGESDLKVAVLDLGAGTFDITILDMSHSLFSVQSTSGDTLLGGKDMDDLVLNYMCSEISRRYSVDLSQDESSMNILREAAEDAKIRLSESRRTSLKPSFRIQGRSFRPEIVLTKDRLERLIQSLVDRMEKPITRALDDSGLMASDIDKLVLVGGPTRMPVIRKRIQEIFGIEPEQGIDPMSVVSMGAFIQASILNGEMKDLLLMDVVPLSLGIETAGGVFTRLISRNTTIPTESSKIFATEEDGQTTMMIHVLQGEREMARGDTSLALFRIDGIPPAPRFEQEVEITFNVDANAILKVSAEVLAIGKKVSVPVRSVKELSQNDIAQMVITATKFDDLDSKLKEETWIRQNADAVLHGAKNTLEKVKHTLTEKEIERFGEALERLGFSLNMKNSTGIRKCVSEVTDMVETYTSRARTLDRARILANSALSNSEMEMPSMKPGDWKVEEVAQGDIEAQVRRLKEMLLISELNKRS